MSYHARAHVLCYRRRSPSNMAATRQHLCKYCATSVLPHFLRPCSCVTLPRNRHAMARLRGRVCCAHGYSLCTSECQALLCIEARWFASAHARARGDQHRACAHCPRLVGTRVEMRRFGVSAEEQLRPRSSHSATARTRVIFEEQHVHDIQSSMLAVASSYSCVQDERDLPMTTNFAVHRSFQRLIHCMLGRQYVCQCGPFSWSSLRFPTSTLCACPIFLKLTFVADHWDCLVPFFACKVC